MRKLLVILFVVLGIIIGFAGTVSAEVIFDFSVDYSGRTNNVAPNYISGPTLDFVVFPPLYGTKDGMEFVFGFGLTTGALFGFRDKSGNKYNAVVPIQLNFNMDTTMDKISKSLHLGGQFRIGLALGTDPMGLNTGFILSAGAIGKYMFTENIGMKISPEFGFLILDDVISPSFSFSVGFVIRFYKGERRIKNNQNNNSNNLNENNNNDSDNENVNDGDSDNENVNDGDSDNENVNDGDNDNENVNDGDSDNENVNDGDSDNNTVSVDLGEDE